MKVRRILTPAVLLTGPVFVSFLVWAIPGNGLYLRGFTAHSAVTLEGSLVLAVWYGACVVSASAGASIGSHLFQFHPQVAHGPRFEGRFGFAVTVLAAIGIVSSYIEISRSLSIVDVLAGGQANLLTSVILGGASISTLRYAAIISAPISIVRAIKGVGSWFFAVFNMILLVLDSVLSSRLALLMAAFVLILLIVQNRPNVRIRLRTAAWSLTLLFAGLTVLNYTRNQNFYRLFGVNDPITMNIYQIAAYVGAPAQVSVGLADAMVTDGFDPSISPWHALGAIVPTFAQAEKSDKSAALDPAIYGYNVDIAPNLNANSAFADTFAQFGWWGLVYVLVVLCIAGTLFGYFLKSPGVLIVVAGVVGYGFLEFWRGLLFNQGIMYFLLLSAMIAAIYARLGTPWQDHQWPAVEQERSTVRGTVGHN